MNLKSINYFTLLFCFATFVAASDNYFQPVALPDYVRVVQIMQKNRVAEEVAVSVARDIAGQQKSEHEIYRALHEAGGYGHQEIYISAYGNAARKIIEAAQQK